MPFPTTADVVACDKEIVRTAARILTGAFSEHGIDFPMHFTKEHAKVRYKRSLQLTQFDPSVGRSGTLSLEEQILHEAWVPSGVFAAYVAHCVQYHTRINGLQTGHGFVGDEESLEHGIKVARQGLSGHGCFALFLYASNERLGRGTIERCTGWRYHFM